MKANTMSLVMAMMIIRQSQRDGSMNDT